MGIALVSSLNQTGSADLCPSHLCLVQKHKRSDDVTFCPEWGPWFWSLLPQHLGIASTPSPSTLGMRVRPLKLQGRIWAAMV